MAEYPFSPLPHRQFAILLVPLGRASYNFPMLWKRFSRLEALAQRLIEGSFSRLLSGRVARQEIITHLVRTLEDGQEAGHIATEYLIYLHPQDFSAYQPTLAEVEQELATYLWQLGQQSGVAWPARPVVRLLVQEDLDPRQVHVEGKFTDETPGVTKQLDPDRVNQAVDTRLAIRKLDAFLILEGQTHIPLSQSVISIGRHTDNDVVLDSPTISRKHAQVRWRYGRFVIYDLGSRSGTKVNGEAVQEYVLQPGDVITLSQTTLIYGEGASTSQRRQLRSSALDGSQTQGMRPADLDDELDELNDLDTFIN